MLKEFVGEEERALSRQSSNDIRRDFRQTDTSFRFVNRTRGGMAIRKMNFVRVV